MTRMANRGPETSGLRQRRKTRRPIKVLASTCDLLLLYCTVYPLLFSMRAPQLSPIPQLYITYKITVIPTKLQYLQYYASSSVWVI